MLSKKKWLFATSLLILTTANFSIANDAMSSEMVGVETVKEKAKEGSLKFVMQGLLKDTQELTSAMLNEDFILITAKAKHIADHPKPSMATRNKLMKAMGAEMINFKAYDFVVHNAALEIVKSAQQNNIDGVGENFKKMIGGCLSCHNMFKSRVSAILK
jgi:cytochrome c556